MLVGPSRPPLVAEKHFAIGKRQTYRWTLSDAWIAFAALKSTAQLADLLRLH